MYIGELYVNPNNITTVIPFCLLNEGLAGVQINGTRYSTVSFEASNEAQAQKALEQARELQEQIIAEIEGKKKGKKK